MAERWAGAEIVVDAAGEEPVYGQIASQIRSAIAAGVLRAEASLPSVRALASDLGVNLNTVARAYRQLEDEGFVEIESRAGVRVVAPGGRVSREMSERLTGELRTLLWRMRQAGFTPLELQRLATRQIASLAEPKHP
jgi:GntR family transcriptional regulator